MTPLFFHISPISVWICSSHSHLGDGKGGKGAGRRKAEEETIMVLVIGQVQKPLDPNRSEFPYDKG